MGKSLILQASENEGDRKLVVSVYINPWSVVFLLQCHRSILAYICGNVNSVDVRSETMKN